MTQGSVKLPTTVADNKPVGRFLKNVDYRIIKYILDNSVGFGVNLPCLAHQWAKLDKVDLSDRKTYNRYIKRVHRLAKYLHSHGYAEITKVDGLTWIKLTKSGVDLIPLLRKTQTTRRIFETFDSVVRRRGLHPSKAFARDYIAKRNFLESKDFGVLNGRFIDYLRDRDNVVVVLRELAIYENYLVFRSKHRFRPNELRRKKRLFRQVYEKSKRYKVGVFITLTVDPKRYASILHATKGIGYALNRLMSFIRRRYKGVGYIAVLEFQNNGNPHYHILLFGISRIEDHRRLTDILIRQGFGMIHYEYKIVNRGEWTWSDSKPAGSGDRVFNYLMKYISKAMRMVNTKVTDGGGSIPKLCLYWATDKRFFTHSRDLAPPREVRRSGMIFVFVWSGYFYEMPDPICELIDGFPVLDPPAVYPDCMVF